MSFGGDDSTSYSPPPPPPVQLPPPPSPKEIMDFIDEVRGVKSIVVNENGKATRRNVRLPKTPDQQRYWRPIEELFSEGIQSMKELARYDLKNVVPITPFINVIANLNDQQVQDLSKIADFGNIQQDVNDFRAVQKDIMNDELKRGRDILENDLARTGRAGGSYAAAQRAYFETEAAKARRLANVEALQYGENLARQRLGRNLQAYEARQGGRENQLRGAQLEYNLKQQERGDLENLRRNALDEKTNQTKLAAALRNEEENKVLGNNAAQIAFQENELRNRNQMNEYNARVNTMNQNYQNQLGYHTAMMNYENQKNQNREDSGLFGALGNVVGTIGGSMLFGPEGSGGSKLFGKIFG